ncbi:hypothetical protein DRN98_06020 [Methanosarcinales archaeon]|nr:MAG: hypothetical protein DRN98_06020 [Methanosarcinales archaeon]
MIMAIIELLESFWLTRGIMVLLSWLIRPLKKSLLKRIENEISISEKEVFLENAYDHPPLNFRIVLDSKASVKLEIERVVLLVSMDEIPLHKFTWLREEREIKMDALGHADDIPEKGKGAIGFRYTLPIYVYHVASRFYLTGYIKIKSPYGTFLKEINEFVNVKDDERLKAVKKIKEFYKEFITSYKETKIIS